jgi:hypothetical protein
MSDNNCSSNLKPISGIIFGSLFLCWWQPGFAEMLTVIEGANQVIPASQISEDICFKLLNDFDNPLTTEAGHAIILTLTTPSNSTAELTTESTITDKNGEIPTSLTATDTLGTYTITAQLETDTSVSVDTYVFVTDPPSVLSSLGIGGAINAEGTPLDTNAEFQGGSSIDGNDFSQDVTYRIDNDSSVFVEGIIQIDSRHLNEKADIVVVAMVTLSNPPSKPEEFFFMLDNLTISREWDGTLASLEAFKNDIVLPKTLSITFSIPLWGGNFVGLDTTLGRYTAYGYFGYRLNDGVIVFNQQPIEITVVSLGMIMK